MTQPEQAVGGSDEPIIAAEPTIEDRFAAFANGDQDEEQAPEAEQPEAEEGEAPAEPELTEEDVAESEADEAPPIAAPVSWDAERKEKFAELPRELQEYVVERESQREKFVQQKSQEAKSAHQEAEKQALTAIQNVSAQTEQAFNALKVAVPEKPSPRLQADDPWAYAERLEAYENATAHNQWIEQNVSQARQMAEHAEQDMQRISHQETEALLRDQFPEYLDQEKGAELRQRLGSTALELGYSADQLANVDGKDILAMRLATDWREKAAKYDKLMAQKMEKVRSAKELPRVSKPGVAQGPGAQENQRYVADRSAMKSGDRDAAVRVFSRFI